MIPKPLPRSLLALSIVGLLAAMLPCSSEEPSSDGHQRMVDTLARLARQSARDNPFLGRAVIDELNERLAATAPDAVDPERWQLSMELGIVLLRVGDTTDAIDHYLRAYGMIRVFGEAMPPSARARTIFELAVAYMRLAETENCALRHTSDSCIFPIQGAGVHEVTEGSETAIRYFSELLATTTPDDPHYLRARWLLNIAYMTLGGYPDRVPPEYLVPEELFASDETDFPRFVDIAPELGLDSFDLSGGAIAEDFNGDGWLDVMVSTSDTSGQLRYYEALGDGRFKERTSEAGLKGLFGGLNLVHADYDNDGDADVYVLRGGWWRQLGRHPNSLLRNNGDGTFRDVTFEVGMGAAHYPTQTASWADYDNDGWLDLYVGNEHSAEISAPCQLFHNNGDGTFTDLAAEAGVENKSYAKAVIWGDYNDDRFPDLFVSNMGDLNRLYRNNGDGTFTDVAAKLGVNRPIAGFGSWFWDFDNDGVLDLFVGTYGGVRQSPDVAAVAASYLGLPHGAEHDHLYRGDGQGGFKEVGQRLGFSRTTLLMGANFGDLDNDGFLDLYLGTGYPHYEALTPNIMYRNVEGSGFADITTAGGFGHLQKGHAIAFADFDHDGDADVLEQMGGAFPGDAFGNALFENPGFGNHWIKLQLVGVVSNRRALGARIRIVVEGPEGRRTIYRRVNSGGSFGGNPFTQEIGLGSATTIERLDIYWPTSGLTQSFSDVPADQRLRIVEEADAYEVLTNPPPVGAGNR